MAKAPSTSDAKPGSAKYLVTFVSDEKLRDSTPPSVVFRGVEFKLNVPVPLEIASPEGEAMIAKLKGNRHFTVETAD